jgi:hypothetical protein
MKTCLALALSLAFLTPAATRADDCGTGVKPATTLLLPYFEVELSKVKKIRRAEKTTVWLENPGSSSVVAHVLFWTDMGLPVVAWDVTLPPFGALEMPLHDVFRGDIERLPGLEDFTTLAPPGVTGDEIIARAIGEEVGNGCLTVPRGDGIVRGYLTIDVPSVALGEEQSQGTVAGWVSYANQRRRAASFEPLVHLNLGDDLPVAWSAHFDISGGSETELIVWRDAAGEAPDPVALCEGTEPNGGYPYTQVSVEVADKDGIREEILVDDDGEAIPGFPFITGRYRLGRGDLELPLQKGTLYLDLSDDFASWVSIRRKFDSSRLQGQAQAIPLGCPE